MNPVKYSGSVARGDAELLSNMQAVMLRALPELVPSQDSRPSLMVIASGPSVKQQVGRIRELRALGVHILAIRGAHDFLIENGIIPDYALTVDPLPDSWKCFSKKHPDVLYWIAAQCPPSVFDHLSDCRVEVWYPQIGRDVQHPVGKLIIAGGTTSGLRGLSVAYVRGYRDFHLFGFDSCLSGEHLRVDGSGIKSTDKVIEIRLDPNGEAFRSNGPMAHQAQQFETYYDSMPDATFKSYGYGLITATIAQREAITAQLNAVKPQPWNNRVSFIHRGGPKMASYRYRAAIPAGEIGASINDMTAGTLVFSKPQATELVEMAIARLRGQRVIVDFCDDHFDWPYYKEALKQAETVVCNTETMRERIKLQGRNATVISDPYEFEQLAPHCNGTKLLWFGHSTNRDSLERIMPDLAGYPLRIVSDFAGAIPWSLDTMVREFANADIVVLPATDTYKSANRAIEAIRQGCFVVAEPHPAWNDIPGIWTGSIKEGIEWISQHCIEARKATSVAQLYVAAKYSPKTVASAWKSITAPPTTSAAANASGPDGSMSMVMETATSPQIYATCP